MERIDLERIWFEDWNEKPDLTCDLLTELVTPNKQRVSCCKMFYINDICCLVVIARK